jgi:hypothetical protein
MYMLMTSKENNHNSLKCIRINLIKEVKELHNVNYNEKKFKTTLENGKTS